CARSLYSNCAMDYW
nr:immunoglobulin heavy chain junction region [Mus musculus]